MTVAKMLLIAPALLAAAPAAATVTYSYAGMIDPTNSRDGGIVNYVGLHAPMTFTFTTAVALAPNLDVFDLSALVLSWRASAGQPESTIDQSYPLARLVRFHLVTNAAGDITGYNIVAQATDPALGGTYGYTPQFYFTNLVPTPETGVTFTENGYGQSIGGAVCFLGSCAQTNSSFVRQDATGAVPEPASWAMMIGGFGVVGGAVRRRARSTVAAMAG